MQPEHHSLKELVKYRLEQAQEALLSAKHNLDFNLQTSLNRSYYAIMYATKALLAADGKDAGSHRGIFIIFNQHYIKTEIFEKRMSAILKNASMIRDKSDYDDFYIISRDEAVTQIENAGFFLSIIKEYLTRITGF